MMSLVSKCHTRAALSCDIFNLGFIIFQCPLTTEHHLYTISSKHSVWSCSVIMEQLGVQHLTSESDPQVPCSENYTTVHNHLFYTLFTNEYWPNAQITHYDDDVVTNWYIGRHFKLSGQSRNTLLCHVLILEAKFACTLTNNRELSGIHQSPCSFTTHLSPW